MALRTLPRRFPACFRHARGSECVHWNPGRTFVPHNTHARTTNRRIADTAQLTRVHRKHLATSRHVRRTRKHADDTLIHPGANQSNAAASDVVFDKDAYYDWSPLGYRLGVAAGVGSLLPFMGWAWYSIAIGPDTCDGATVYPWWAAASFTASAAIMGVLYMRGQRHVASLRLLPGSLVALGIHSAWGAHRIYRVSHHRVYVPLDARRKNPYSSRVTFKIRDEAGEFTLSKTPSELDPEQLSQILQYDLKFEQDSEGRIKLIG